MCAVHRDSSRSTSGSSTTAAATAAAGGFRGGTSPGMVPRGEQQQQQLQQQQAALLALGTNQADAALDSMLPSLLDVLLQHSRVEEFVEEVCTITTAIVVA
jgi:hypothetical protein